MVAGEDTIKHGSGGQDVLRKLCSQFWKYFLFWNLEETIEALHILIIFPWECSQMFMDFFLYYTYGITESMTFSFSITFFHLIFFFTKEVEYRDYFKVF